MIKSNRDESTSDDRGDPEDDGDALGEVQEDGASEGEEASSASDDEHDSARASLGDDEDDEDDEDYSAPASLRGLAAEQPHPPVRLLSAAATEACISFSGLLPCAVARTYPPPVHYTTPWYAAYA